MNEILVGYQSSEAVTACDLGYSWILGATIMDISQHMPEERQWHISWSDRQIPDKSYKNYLNTSIQMVGQ